MDTTKKLNQIEKMLIERHDKNMTGLVNDISETLKGDEKLHKIIAESINYYTEYTLLRYFYATTSAFKADGKKKGAAINHINAILNKLKKEAHEMVAGVYKDE